MIQAVTLLRVGACTLDSSDGTLRSQSGSTHLEPRVQAVLLLLAERHGAVVSQQELLRQIWVGTHVAPGALARVISLLRQALGDDVRRPCYIETVPKRGYRLIAAVEWIDTAPVVPQTAPLAAPDPRRPVWTKYAAAAAAIAAASALALPFAIGPWARNDLPPSVAVRGTPGYRLDTRVGNEIAFDHYVRAVERDPASADAYAGLAKAYVLRANYLPDRARWAGAALDSARHAAAIDPDNVSAVRALAMAHAQSGRLRDAAAYYRRALDVCPHDSATRTNLGRVLLASGRVAEALTLFESHAVSEPDSPAGYTHLAGGLAVAGYPAEAASAARAALALEPYERDAQMVLVRLDLLESRPGDAAARLTRLLDVYPDCTPCIVQLGLIEQLRGRDEEAAARFRQARAMSPQFVTATLRLAQVTRRAGQRPEAEALLEDAERQARTAIARGDETPFPRWQLAAAAAVRGDRVRARSLYERAVAAGRRDATWDGWDPLLSAVQSDARFIALHAAFDREHRAAAPVARRTASR